MLQSTLCLPAGLRNEIRFLDRRRFQALRKSLSMVSSRSDTSFSAFGTGIRLGGPVAALKAGLISTAIELARLKCGPFKACASAQIASW